MDNYYKILGIERGSTASEIRSAFRICAKKYHPDNSKSESTRSKFISSYEAYKILSNHKLRKEYNLNLSNEEPSHLKQEVIRIRVEGERYASSFRLFYWQFFVLFFIELVLGHNRLTFPAVLLTILGIASIIRGFLNHELTDFSVGLGTTAFGVVLLLIAARRIFQYIEE